MDSPDGIRENFNYLMRLYEVDEEEMIFEKKRIMANLEEATACYADIADSFRKFYQSERVDAINNRTRVDEAVTG